MAAVSGHRKGGVMRRRHIERLMRLIDAAHGRTEGHTNGHTGLGARRGAVRGRCVRLNLVRWLRGYVVRAAA